MTIQPLSREDIIRTIEGTGHAPRVPVMLHLWNGAGAFAPEQQPFVTALQAKYPQDVDFKMPSMPGISGSNRWINYKDITDDGRHGLDSNCYMEDIEAEIDRFIETMPDANHPELFAGLTPSSGERYTLIHWWYWLFERQWWLRGMENALTDFYLYPEETHKLFAALTQYYKQVIRRARKELHVDGVFISDDIGAQNGPFFSPEIFREFFLPYYRELIEEAHRLGMHFWMHSCGNIEPFIPDLIEAGLDVLHPIQKYTMNQQEIAAKYGSKLCIWAGFDVQQTIPYGTPEEVAAEVRFLKETFDRPEGRFMLTAGNGITGDCPLPSLEALYAACYGER